MAGTTRRKFLKNSAYSIAATTLGVNAGYLPVGNPDFLQLREKKPGNDAVIAQAKQDILKNRRREVTLLLRDQQGNLLKNYPVEVMLQRHAFLFGDNNVGMDQLFRQGKINTTKAYYYRKRFAEVLNACNCTCYWAERPRHDMAKTEYFQGEFDFEGFTESVNWANAQGLTAKGHPMFWTVPKAIPDWLEDYPYETQIKFVETRIRRLAARYKGRVKLWDICNEALWEPALKNLDKREWPYLETIDNHVEMIAPLIRWAREEDPDAQYLLNDYGTSQQIRENLTSADGREVTYQLQRQRYKDLVQRLVDAGAAPNAMGLQCHTGGWQMPDAQLAFYDEMAEAGIPLHVTEFGAGTDHLQEKGLSKKEIEEKRAEYVSNYLITAFSHPAIEAFFFWGFMGMGLDWDDGDSAGHELTPVFHKVKDLIHREWHTHEKLQTNEEGMVNFKGFPGDYTLRFQMQPNESSTRGITFGVHNYQKMPLQLTVG